MIALLLVALAWTAEASSVMPAISVPEMSDDTIPSSMQMDLSTVPSMTSISMYFANLLKGLHIDSASMPVVPTTTLTDEISSYFKNLVDTVSDVASVVPSIVLTDAVISMPVTGLADVASVPTAVLADPISLCPSSLVMTEVVSVVPAPVVTDMIQSVIPTISVSE